MKKPSELIALKLEPITKGKPEKDADAMEIFQQGIKFHREGLLEQARTIYEKLLVEQPQHADALHLLGVIFKQTGAPDLAVRFISKALEVDPSIASAYSNRGLAFQDLRCLDEALASFDQAIKIEPGYAEAFYNRGNVLTELKRPHEALASYDKALSIKPDFAEGFFNRGNALTELGRLEEALDSYEKAILVKPDYAAAFVCRGDVLQKLRFHNEALASYDSAIFFKPDYAEAFYNRGTALRELKNLNEAVGSYRKAILIMPDYAEAHINLGLTLSDLGRFSEAAASYKEAIRIKPDFPEAHNNLGVTLNDLGHLSEAEACYREALRLKSDYTDAYSNLLFSSNYAQSSSTATVLNDAKRYGVTTSAKAIPKFNSWHISAEPAKLKIGLVSGDLIKHPVGYFVEGLLNHLDRQQFEIYGFPSTLMSDDLTIRIQSYIHHWLPIAGMSDSDAAELIHRQGIHILIDLSGHTAHNRLPVFAFKPAPVQVSWLGYFATTGLPEMDYFLGDRCMATEEEQRHFTERLCHLPETWLCRLPPNEMVPVGPLPAFSNGYFTFGCFGNLAKMNDQVVKLWSSILKKIPDSRLHLKSKQLIDPIVVDEIRHQYAGQGISNDRLILEGPSSIATYFEAYNKIDMVLDTFPYPGGTTSVDALWMGVPVLTLKGCRFLSRLGESIAINAGQAQWIAQDAVDYVKKAIEFASDLSTLARNRQSLRHRVIQTPLFDTKRFAKNFECALWGMWEAKITDVAS